MLHTPTHRTVSGRFAAILLTALCALLTLSATESDIPKKFIPPTDRQDFIKREVMIPMRDGVKLFTVIVLPKGAHNAPILLTRTPYNASERVSRTRASTCFRFCRKETMCSSRRLHPGFPGRARKICFDVRT